MDQNLRRKIICAIDTGNLDEALAIVHRLKDWVGAFKIGHALTLPNGLSVVDRLKEVGADRIFLDLKLHDIPNSVGVGIREISKHGVWMTTLHLSGGPAMITAAVEEAAAYGEGNRPLLVGVSVLTSLDQSNLTNDLGISRTIVEQAEHLSRMGIECGLDGVVTSVEECAHLRKALGHSILVVPGIRPSTGEVQDQVRVGDGRTAISLGADYLVIGRALAGHQDPGKALSELGFDV